MCQSVCPMSVCLSVCHSVFSLGQIDPWYCPCSVCQCMIMFVCLSLSSLQTQGDMAETFKTAKRRGEYCKSASTSLLLSSPSLMSQSRVRPLSSPASDLRSCPKNSRSNEFSWHAAHSGGVGVHAACLHSHKVGVHESGFCISDLIKGKMHVKAELFPKCLQCFLTLVLHRRHCRMSHFHQSCLIHFNPSRWSTLFGKVWELCWTLMWTKQVISGLPADVGLSLLAVGNASVHF